MNYCEDLEFDLPAKLLEELVRLFAAMPAGTLTLEHVDTVPEHQGVYQLLLDDRLVYIGKTDSSAGLKARLSRHANKIKNRVNLDPQRVSFKAIRVYVFSAMDLEELLISHFKAHDQAPLWQHSGFGSNDPGRERDTSKLKDGHFDALFPIDIDVVVAAPEAPTGSVRVSDLLTHIRKQVSYVLRSQTTAPASRKPHEDLVNSSISPIPEQATVRDYLRLAAAALGPEWQITALPGYVIVYKEAAVYKSGIVIGPDGDRPADRKA